MANSSIIRRVDSLGRIVIPMELRRILHIEENDTLEIVLDNGMIYIKKQKCICTFCGDDKEISPYKGRHVCVDCVSDLR